MKLKFFTLMALDSYVKSFVRLAQKPLNEGRLPRIPSSPGSMAKWSNKMIPPEGSCRLPRPISGFYH